MTGPRNLPIKSAVGLKEPLITQRATEIHFAFGTDFRRSNHRRQHIAKMIVEIARDQSAQRLVQRNPAAQQQHKDPRKRNEQHTSAQRAGMPRTRRKRGSADARRKRGLSNASQRRVRRAPIRRERDR